jgi:hypothetical protein
VFLIISGAAFTLLDLTQQRYKMESEYLDTFQGARQIVDSITRDIHTAGYPPANQFSAPTLAANPALAALPFAWSPGYPNIACTVNINCGLNGGPAAFDLILVADINPAARDGVEWIRYRLNRTVLERAVATKALGADPEATTRPFLQPYLDNVMNNTSPAQMNQLRVFYPGIFPGNNPVPLFTYVTDPGAPATPINIREVNITVIVLSPNPDPRNQQPRLVTLTARARRINPNQ